MNNLKKLLEKAKENQAIYQSPAVVRVSIPDAKKLLALVGAAELERTRHCVKSDFLGECSCALCEALKALEK